MLFFRKFLFFILVYHFFLLEKSLHFFIQIIMERFLTPINSIKPKKVRGHRILFTRAEDKLLTSIMETQPFHNWNEVSKFFKNRNARQCRDRWINYLSQDINNGPWSPEEDQLLANLYNQYGPKWATIAKFFDKRRENNVKNRWYANIRNSSIILENGFAKFMGCASKKGKVGKNINHGNICPESSSNASSSQESSYSSDSEDSSKIENEQSMMSEKTDEEIEKEMNFLFSENNYFGFLTEDDLLNAEMNLCRFNEKYITIW